uniref:NADH dehydrogenase subunit 2 n=1 Tax=Cichlidogyrus halli TaxID=321991 RepID=UPI00315D4EF3
MTPNLFALAASLYLLSLSWPSLLGVWISLEAANLIVLTGFFSFSGVVNRYAGLLGAILMSGVSSGLLFASFLNDAWAMLLLLSFVIKVGMFPFVSWVIVVLVNSPWGVLYFLGSFSKIGLLYFSPFLSVINPSVTEGFFLLTFLFLINSYLGGVGGFKNLIALSSVSTGSLTILFLGSLGISSAALFLLVYLVYSFIFIVIISKVEKSSISMGGTLLSIQTLLGVPFSLGILYKVLGSYYILYFSGGVIMLWVVFSCLEFIIIGLWLFEKSSVNEFW